MPGEGDLINEDGQFKLKQEYAIGRMNEIYGQGNWNIKEVKNELQKSTKNNTAQNVCAMTVEYKHPISGCWLTTYGTAPMNFSADESVMQNAFLNAIAKLGTTFGETLMPAEATTELAPKESYSPAFTERASLNSQQLAAVI
jgi:hypothetical protein